MQHIYIIRHCKAEGQPPDARLTQEGEEQAQALADFLSDKEIDCIISSPFTRAVQTAQPLLHRIDVEMQTDMRLSERVLCGDDVPDWMEHLRASFDDMDKCLPGGESSRTATERVVSVIKEIQMNTHRNYALITHGNLMTLLLKHFDDQYSFEQWQKLTNPDVYLLTVAGDHHQLIRIWDRQ